MARVILIDDDPLFADLVRRCLEQDGHSVEYNRGAYGALTAVRKGRYDVILVDVEMPGIEGPKLVEYLRERGVGGARIVLTSSVPEARLRQLVCAYGAHEYFCKGWGLERLIAAVRAADRFKGPGDWSRPETATND
jgi:two-component system response regulator MprA